METLFSRGDLDGAADLVYETLSPTHKWAWPLLAKRTGSEVWVKHENHTPIGAFKVRGGLVLLDHLVRTNSVGNGLITATRGNHGQSIPLPPGSTACPSKCWHRAATHWKRMLPCGPGGRT